MGAMTKAELEAMIKRLQRSLERATTRIAALDKSLERSAAKNAALSESLDRAKTKNKTLGKSLNDAYEQQRATAEILSLIPRSPADTQPVFDAIVKSSVHLFGGLDVSLRLIKDDHIVLVASTRTDWRSSGGVRIGRAPGMPQQRAIVLQDVVQIEDTLNVDDAPDDSRRRWERRGIRAILVAPMMRGGEAIGTISVSRATPGKFTDEQVVLLKTFADQAVIAIENARLFNETKEALEQQTVISEVLRIISGSPTNTQPVFDAIVKSGVRFFGGMNMSLRLIKGENTVTAAATVPVRPETGGEYPAPLSDLGGLSARAIHFREVVQIPDILDPPDWVSSLTKKRAELRGYRANMAAPMLREGRAIGTLNLTRATPGPLTAKQVALLQTFADQAVIAIENVRLFKELQARNAEITTALEQQTATAEILRVISQSPTDVQPVFDTIAESAARLCESLDGVVFRRDGDRLVLVAHRGGTPLGPIGEFTLPLGRGNIPGRVIADGQAVHVADLQAESAEFPEGSEVARRTGFRTALGVPLMREGVAIGVIGVRRTEAQLFSDRQVALLKTFADQAVIAIENVRLFRELEARNGALSESLARQTATADILRIISTNLTDVQPVLDAVAESAARLCGADDVVIRLVEGEMHRPVAHYGTLVPAPPRSLKPGPPASRAMLERRTIHVDDASALTNEYEGTFMQSIGVRTVLVAPLLREENAIGAIVLRRLEVNPFSATQIELLETFAAQAVIAIENVRLFRELEARNAEVTEALEQQTATAEILKVISSSPTELQPVFDVILENATRLCDAQRGSVGLFDGEKYEHLAVRGMAPEHRNQVFNRGPRIPVEGTNLWRMVSERRPIHVHDLVTNPQVRSPVPVALNQGVRTLLLVPMLKDGRVVGGIIIFRYEVRPFTQEQIDLVSTFASQAVIAIENVRLFKELQAQTEALSRSVKQLTALGEVGQAISSSLDLETVLKTIVSRALMLTGLDAGSIYEYDPQAQVFRLQATENIEAEIIEAVRTSPIHIGDGVVGHTGVTRENTQVPDILDPSYQSGRRELLVRAGYRALLAVPLLRDEHLLGVLLVHRKSPGVFPSEVVELLKTFATQSALAIQNARLFREIAEKSRQLEVASQHKSQFLASMSHELRTPLNAILGFNEMMLDGLYGELPEDLKDPLQETQTSGRHLLRLINNVLDLAKIEAGRMELALADYAVQDMVESVRSTLRPLAEAKGLEFNVAVPSDIPLAYGDAGRLTQCLMNLAGNSLKFTKAGQVAISVATKGDILAFRVLDTGIGIPAEKIDSLFTEFKQTDATIASEYGGTGLGLAITRQFIEMHGGRIWVESEPGKGSTFIFEIPLRAGEVAQGKA